MRCLIYTRVSTDQQTTENQIMQLKEFVTKKGWTIFKIVTDVCSGGKSIEERQGLNEAFILAHQKKYDVLLFWSLDRFSREGSRKTLEYLTRLENYGVKYHSYTEEYISSLGLFADAIISILSSLAHQEKVRLSERTIAGLNRTRANGTKLGRPKTAQAIIMHAKSLRETGKSYAEIGKAMGISKARAYQLVKTEVK